MEEKAEYIVAQIDSSLSMPDKLKRVVIKEELYALTGHWLKALILNQFLYWSERTKDADKYIREEAERLQLKDTPIEYTHGWIYKKAEDLNDELMVDMSVATIRKYLKELVADGYLDERNNPKYGWDRTLQYRPNFVKVIIGCLDKGYVLGGYKWTVPMLKILRNAILENKIASLETKIPTNKILTAIPEITTETTTNINGADAPKNEVPSVEETMTEFPDLFGDEHDEAANDAYKARLLRAVGNAQERQEAGEVDLSWLPEHQRPLARAFVEAAGNGHQPVSSDRSLWRKTLNEWFELSFTPNQITNAVKHMRSEGLTIGGIQSVTKTARDGKGGDQEVVSHLPKITSETQFL